MHFQPKRGSDPTELADLLARDLYEWVRSGCQEPPKWWDRFRNKIYCRGDGALGKFGVKVFPTQTYATASRSIAHGWHAQN